MSKAKTTKLPSYSDSSFLGLDESAPQVRIEYRIDESVESTALETVFNYLFEQAEKQFNNE
jgi:hypothetical protein